MKEEGGEPFLKKKAVEPRGKKKAHVRRSKRAECAKLRQQSTDRIDRMSRPGVCGGFFLL